MRKRILRWLDLPKVDEARSSNLLDFDQMARAYPYPTAVTQSGGLAIRVESQERGPAYIWRSLKRYELAAWITRYLTANGQAALWDSALVDDFQLWLLAQANPVPVNDRLLA
jgi:hypothetical protein